MNKIYTEGKTIFKVTPDGEGHPFAVTVLSQRAAMLVWWKSMKGEWEKPVIKYREPFKVGPFLMFGFQPASGYHIVVKE